jgi:hypothetical protein
MVRSRPDTATLLASTLFDPFLSGKRPRSTRPNELSDPRADIELYEALQRGDLSYVLDTRQMGKSSLIASVGKRLKETGAAMAFVDISGLGATVTIDQWYDRAPRDVGQGIQARS